VRRRLQGRAALLAILAALAALTITSLITPLAAAWMRPERTGTLRVLAVLFASGAIGSMIAFGVVIPRRRFRRDDAVARWVGDAAPQVASDLLSAVELERALAAGGATFSPELAFAAAAGTADRIEELLPSALVPREHVKRAGVAFTAAVLLYAAFVLVRPGAVKMGWHRLLTRPPRPRTVMEAALAMPEPIVGDITISLAYPAYTKRPALVVPASSGDVTAPRGTEITITARALTPVPKARLLFDGEPDSTALPLTIDDDGDGLKVTFKLDKPASYRFLLEPQGKRPLVEANPHHLELEADRAPRVELYAPADELEVSSRKRIELAYTADDDYGISQIALVWRTPGGHDERRVLPAPRTGARSAQGKWIWDLADLTLTPGARIAYHLEVKDNDDVGGPNVGVSRTFYLKVFSPRERHAELLARQDAVREMALALLADRLEVDAGDLEKHKANQQSAGRLVVELGQLAALVATDTLATKGLKDELETMRQRLDALDRDEQRFLSEITGIITRSPGHQITPPLRAMMADEDKKQIGELEKDTLLLDDWLERQRMEELLTITDEIKQHRDRLKELMAEYKRTGSEKVREEIEREMKALAELEAELARKQSQLGGEVADRYLNADALASQDGQDCLAKVHDLIEKGDVAGADAQLAKCSAQLDQAAAALEQGLRGLRGDRFSDEEKQYSELMNEVADLEHEERQLAREADDVNERYEKRAAEVARDRANPQKEKAKKTLEKLKKTLAETPRDGLTGFAQEQADNLKRRLDDVSKMIDEGDVAEALAMAKQAKDDVGTIQAELDDDLQSGQPTSDKTEEAASHMKEAAPLADKLVEELEKATPSPQEIMSPQDRRKMDELKRRQQSLESRARQLGQKAQKGAKQLPGKAGEAAKDGLDDAADQMGRAGKRMGEDDPSGSREEAHGAADKLGGMRKQMGQSSRPTTVGPGNGNGTDEDQPVRIPNAEDYKPPEEFREDILNAKRKEKAPDAFRDQVDRYYQELVK
jgi:hypothetical protein